MQLQKIAALCEVSFLQKIDKMVLKICQKRIFGQKVNFFIYGTLTRAANFALHSVHQDPYFEVPKSMIGHFFRFFNIRGDPFDLG